MFAPTLSGSLGIIENSAFITFLEIMILVLKSFSGIFAAIGTWVMSNPITSIVFIIPSVLLPLIAPAVPALLTGFAFGAFHITSYSLQIAAMIWAGLIFLIWIISWWFTNKDTTPMDVAHYLWNAINTGRATFQVAF